MTETQSLTIGWVTISVPITAVDDTQHNTMWNWIVTWQKASEIFLEKKKKEVKLIGCMIISVCYFRKLQKHFFNKIGKLSSLKMSSGLNTTKLLAQQQ